MLGPSLAPRAGAGAARRARAAVAARTCAGRLSAAARSRRRAARRTSRSGSRATRPICRAGVATRTESSWACTRRRGTGRVREEPRDRRRTAGRLGAQGVELRPRGRACRVGARARPTAWRTRTRNIRRQAVAAARQLTRSGGGRPRRAASRAASVAALRLRPRAPAGGAGGARRWAVEGHAGRPPAAHRTAGARRVGIIEQGRGHRPRAAWPTRDA